jgi:hypothetical protein
MDCSAGLHVSVKETSVCIVDDAGRIVLEVKVANEPEALLQVLAKPRQRHLDCGEALNLALERIDSRLNLSEA